MKDSLTKDQYQDLEFWHQVIWFESKDWPELVDLNVFGPVYGQTLSEFIEFQTHFSRN